MESTGVYWKPVSNLLEDDVTLLLVNARHVKAVPGRKTDAKDCEWLADLLRHGLLQSSFVPDRPQRELRELTRYRTSLVRERTAAANRLQKTLEGANIKLAAVATDILGKSGREILAALVDGETDAAELAQLAKGRLREKLPELERALTGRVGSHQRFLIAQQFAHVDFLDASIEQMSAEVVERVRPDEEAIERLDAIPGIGRRVAEALVAEIGTDMGRFPSAHHLASWAGMCPGNHERAGKRAERQNAHGQPLASRALGAGRSCRGADEGHLPRDPVPSAGGPPGQEPGRRGGRALHPRHRLPPAATGHHLPRSRPSLFRRTRSRAGRTPVGPSAARPRLPGDARAFGGRLTAPRFIFRPGRAVFGTDTVDETGA